ncbi:hypothetical protein CH330_01350 [candidate division WOR-3 bacterium JGI_Cruoil_03_51_56]|uniref:Methyltransferase type 12 domain-containing protein n=1 Tax=candidate division WOR-3 bacterium JGI_Cruoil_03_51_56 TaxID=1973747 RepID=A0A235BXI9_UNCW3|nr:MAG: hypothetical protein CH330_01350 [candidate division WOR-3 bacterium JGI_Cruoil_03_51_56]
MIFDKKTDYLFWRKFQFYLLKKYGAKPEHKLLDYGCGEFYGLGEYGNRVGPLLIKYLDEGNYYGLDIRKSVYKENTKIVQEQEELEAKHPKLIYIENMDSVQIFETFDYVWAFSVVIHMGDEILDKFLNFVSSHLKKTGVLYMNVNIAPRNTRCYWKGFPVVERPMNFYTVLTGKYGLTITDIGGLASFGYRHDPAAERQRMLRVTRV